MAHGHAVSGVTAYLAVLHLTDADSRPATVAVGAAVAAGAALVPDLDHPGSTLSRAGGAATQAVSMAVSGLAGGHRQLTHSIAAVIAAWAAAVWAAGRPTVAAWACGTLIGVAVPLLTRSLPRRVRLPVAAGGIPAAVWVGRSITTGTVPLDGWFPLAIAVGVAAHLAGDWLTVGGVPLLAPLSRRRFSAGLLRTGGLLEPLVTTALALAAVWLAAPHAAPMWDSLGGPR